LKSAASSVRIDPTKLFLKVMGKSATGNQSLTGKFQNDLPRYTLRKRGWSQPPPDAPAAAHPLGELGGCVLGGGATAGWHAPK
jgi:hypothetical protein